VLGARDIRCSNRCANPLRPGVWFAAPTWYQTLTDTCGSRRSSLRMTVSPFCRRYLSNLISGSAARAGSAQNARTTAVNTRATASLLRKEGRPIPARRPWQEEFYWRLARKFRASVSSSAQIMWPIGYSR
jgi:hypothetical protein